MKKLSIFLCMALCALPFTTSCVEDIDDGGKDDGGKEPSGETVDLTIEAPITKAHLEDDRYVVWDEGDMVNINDMHYQVEPDPEKPGFATVRDVQRADSYIAYYGKYSWMNISGDELECYSGYSCHYMENGPDDNMMVAYSETESLVFQNLNGVLKVGVTGNGERLKAISLTGNSGEQLYGSRLISRDDLIAGRLDEFRWKEGYHEPMTMNLEEHDIVLGAEPVWFYFSLPPTVFGKGFSLNMADTEGRICSKSNSSEVEIERSVITEVENALEFEPVSGLSFEVTETTHNSITVAIKGEPKTSVNVGAIYSSFYTYMCRENGLGEPDGITEEELLHNLVAWYPEGSVMLGEDGTASYTIKSTIALDYTKHLASDSDFKVFAGYCAGEDIVSEASMKDARTAAATGTGPGLAEPEANLTFKSIEHKVRTAAAAHAYYYYMSKEEYEEVMSEPTMQFDDDAIFLLWTEAVTGEQLAMMNGEGLWLEEDYRDVIPDTEYILWLTVTAEGGVEERRKVEFRTPKYIRDEWTYETVSEETSFSFICDAYGEGKHEVRDLTLRKVTGQDIFLLENPFPSLGAPSGGISVTDNASEWIVIDATDHAAVKLERAVNYVGLMVYYDEWNQEDLFLASRKFAWEGADYRLGIYDYPNQWMNLGDLYIGSRLNEWMQVYDAVVDWQPTSGDGGMTTEDFMKDPEPGSWK